LARPRRLPLRLGVSTRGSSGSSTTSGGATATASGCGGAGDAARFTGGGSLPLFASCSTGPLLEDRSGAATRMELLRCCCGRGSGDGGASAARFSGTGAGSSGTVVTISRQLSVSWL